MQRTENGGFTLLEMSIVMLVLAVLAGGVLVGKSLIHTAELRASIQQVEMFNVAFNTFRLKYGCLPGDCNNATSLGFQAGFTIRLSKVDAPSRYDFLDHLSPVSTAFAFTLMESELTVYSLHGCADSGALVREPHGGLDGGGMGGSALESVGGGTVAGGCDSPHGGAGSPVGGVGGGTPGAGVGSASVVQLDGDNNSQLNTDPATYKWEGAVAWSLIDQSGLAAGLEKSTTRMYLKNSNAFAQVGGKTFPAFFYPTYLEIGNDSNGYPNIISEPGNQYLILGSFQPFTAASVHVADIMWWKQKADSTMHPLKGTIRVASTALTNLRLGITYYRTRDLGMGKCLVRDPSITTSDEPMLNYDGIDDPNARCAAEIRASF